MKTIASIIAALALALTVMTVPAVATAANAAPQSYKTAYPGTVNTRCSYLAPRKVKRKRTIYAAARVKAAGNARPAGRIRYEIYRFKRSRVAQSRVFTRYYVGPKFQRVRLLKARKRGWYHTKMTFTPNRGSVYKGCTSNWRTIRVR